MPETITRAELDFRNLMRKLWEEHVTWTRLLIVSFAADLQDTDLVTKRLLNNQVDIGNGIKQYYGDVAGNLTAELLKKHILIALQVLIAARLKDKTGMDSAKKQWFQNADGIAAFLSGTNPFWEEKVLKATLYEHLKLTAIEAVARLNGHYEADMAAYEKVQELALLMADALSEGVIQHFPDRFM